MDYDAFFKDVVHWIGQVNQVAVRYGMDKEEFWNWVVDSSSDMCRKYNDHRLVIKQMMMLSDWLEEVSASQK